METTDRILALLYDRGEGLFALDELASAGGVGRGELDVALGELRRRGQRLESSPAGGVRLLRPVRLAASLIERDLPTRRVGRSVICFAEVSSTNDVALEAIRQADADGLVVLAEWQRGGRGRHGRRWISQPGRNILLSALLTEPVDRGGLRHEALTIATGLAVAEAIEAETALSCELKWPNDVLLEGAKVAGVLVETRRRDDRLGVVLGVGINVNAAPSGGEPAVRATALIEHLGHPVERVEIVRRLLGRLDEWLAAVEAGQLDRLHRAFLDRCRMINQRVVVRCGDHTHTGRVLDVDPFRGLILCHDDGSRADLPAERSTVVG